MLEAKKEIMQTRSILDSPKFRALLLTLCVIVGISLAIAVVLAFTDMGNMDLGQTVDAAKSGGNSANQGIGQLARGGNSANQGIGQ
jgi:hypothetical protein